MGIQDRKIREKENRIELIKDAGKSVFFEKGFQKTTMEEIANLAEISKGTIYLYFKNKDDLYTSILLAGNEWVRERLIRFEKDLEEGEFKSSGDLVMGFFKMDFEIYNENPDSLKIYQSFQLNNLFLNLSKENFDRINDGGRENLRISRRIIAKAIDMNLFPKLDPVRVIDIFRAVFLGNIQLGERKPGLPNRDYFTNNLELSFSLLSKGIEALNSSQADGAEKTNQIKQEEGQQSI